MYTLDDLTPIGYDPGITRLLHKGMLDGYASAVAHA